LLTLETDKASMEVPSPKSGTVKEVKVKVGDKVSEGSVVVMLEVAGDGAQVASSEPHPAVHETGAAAVAPGDGGGGYGGGELEDVLVPDIGDFKDVDVIEVLVKEGDTLAAEDALVTLETDKASMEVPTPLGGTVQEVKVKVGDKVSQGSLLCTLQVAGKAAAPAAAAAAPGKPAAPAPQAASYAGSADVSCDVVVLGSGPGGYTAAFRAADLGQKVVLVERNASLGGVCLNVGCIPSKALLHAAKVIDEAADFKTHGITFAAPEIDIDAVRSWKDGVVKRLTGGLAGLAKQRKVQAERVNLIWTVISELMYFSWLPRRLKLEN
jgi:dihydrolipoamide dehydrogenase